ncbi:disks large 1 tumor suppressor protein isoform X17 [Vespula maculifrons]|uniref:Disks large 1 tumor suppressor protein isoform X17 n=1 Tax=Vespula maculifrons TaxID=7453 RepID=A0ABD2CYM9_VESMC
MPPTTPTDSAMCSLCPRSKKAQHPKKLVRFDSVVDTFSITDSGTTNNRRVSFQDVEHAVRSHVTPNNVKNNDDDNEDNDEVSKSRSSLTSNSMFNLYIKFGKVDVEVYRKISSRNCSFGHNSVKSVLVYLSIYLQQQQVSIPLTYGVCWIDKYTFCVMDTSLQNCGEQRDRSWLVRVHGRKRNRGLGLGTDPGPSPSPGLHESKMDYFEDLQVLIYE